jgi:hypothetical protein
LFWLFLVVSTVSVALVVYVYTCDSEEDELASNIYGVALEYNARAIKVGRQVRRWSRRICSRSTVHSNLKSSCYALYLWGFLPLNK